MAEGKIAENETSIGGCKRDWSVLAIGSEFDVGAPMFSYSSTPRSESAPHLNHLA
jgi:hypothetical protein